MIRLNVSLSNDLNEQIDKAADETETNKSEIFRKALTLYLAAREGKKKGDGGPSPSLAGPP